MAPAQLVPTGRSDFLSFPFRSPGDLDPLKCREEAAMELRHGINLKVSAFEAVAEDTGPAMPLNLVG